MAYKNLKRLFYLKNEQLNQCEADIQVYKQTTNFEKLFGRVYNQMIASRFPSIVAFRIIAGVIDEEDLNRMEENFAVK